LAGINKHPAERIILPLTFMLSLWTMTGWTTS